MSKIAKRSIFILSMSFVVSLVVLQFGFLMLNDEGSFFASLVAGFCVFVATLALDFKIIALFFDRHVFEKKKKSKTFSHTIDKGGNEIFSITDTVSLSFKPSSAALFDVIDFAKGKTLFYLCDIEGEKETCDIVRRVTLATFDAVKNPLELEATMQYLDKSIRLLNMKGTRISVLLGLVDTEDTENMKISFINGTPYNLFSSKNNEMSVMMPLISNKYVLATEKQLPFIVTEYQIRKDDVISITQESGK